MRSIGPRLLRVVGVGGAVSLVVVAVALLLAPLLVLLATVATGLPDHPTLRTIATVLAPQNLQAIWQTLRISLGAVVVAGVVGVPAAIAVQRTDVRGATVLGALLAVPLAIPSYLLAFAFRAAFDDRIGLLSFVSVVVGDIDSAGGISVVLGVSLLPLVVLRLRATLSSIDGALEEAARTAGASALRALLDVTVPLCVPSVVSSLVLVFAASAAAFGVPMLLGLAANEPVVVVTTRITVALQSGSATAINDALGLSVALATLSGLAFAIPAFFAAGAVVVSGKAARPMRLSLGAARWPTTLVLWSAVIVLVIVPLACLVLQGLTLHAGGGVGLDNVGLHHVVDVLRRAEVRAAARTSAVLAIVAAGVIVVFAVVVVVAKRRVDKRWQLVFSGLTRLVELTYALPGTVVAVALILTFAAELRLIVVERVTLVLALGGTTALLLLAYVVKEAALGFRAVDEALDQLHPCLEEAARLAGAGPVRAFVDVTLPLLRPHLVAAAVAVALPCFTELTMSVLLQAPGTSTLGVVLFSLYEYGDPQQAMALAAVLVVVALAAQGLILRLRRAPAA